MECPQWDDVKTLLVLTAKQQLKTARTVLFHAFGYISLTFTARLRRETYSRNVLHDDEIFLSRFELGWSPKETHPPKFAYLSNS